MILTPILWKNGPRLLFFLWEAALRILARAQQGSTFLDILQNSKWCHESAHGKLMEGINLQHLSSCPGVKCGGSCDEVYT